jgi:hypothetical protein
VNSGIFQDMFVFWKVVFFLESEFHESKFQESELFFDVW